MKRSIFTLLLALLLALPLAAPAQETPRICVYVARDAMPRETALRLIALARQTYPQAEWDALFEEDEGRTLREMVLADEAPQIALCAPGEALPWAEEGLLVPLEGRVTGLSRMQPEVVDACVADETLYVAPLLARHRRVAVNAGMLRALGLEHLLDGRTHGVWLPSEALQAAEEASLAGGAAMDVWLSDGEDAAALEALLQALYGGALQEADGEAMADALGWLQDLVQAGMAGVAEDRQAALERFLSGETLLFIDWTDADAEACREALSGMEWTAMPYPSAQGVTVRSFETTGAAVFAGRDAQASALALQAVALWSQDERSGGALGARGLWKDGAVWLRAPGGTLRSLFAGAARAALLEGEDAGSALRRVREVMRAVEGG